MNIYANPIFFLILVFAVIMIILFSLKNRYSSILLILIFTIFTLDAIFLGNFPVISINKINVGILDILFASLIILSAFRLIVTRGKRLEITHVLWGMLLLISWIRGIGLFGLEKATNLFRTYFYFYASFLAIISLTLSRTLIVTLVKYWGVVSWILVALAIERWLLVSMGVLQNPNWLGPSGLMIRVLNASQTNFLLQSVILSQTLPKRLKEHIPMCNLLSIICILIIFLLQHRTVWVIFIVYFFIFALLIPQSKMNLVRFFLFISLAISIGLLSLYAGGSPLTIIDSAARNIATFNWRLESWKALLSSERYINFLDYLLGQPFGTGYERYMFEASTPVEVSPHNFYVQTFLNIGGIGLAIVATIYIKTLLGLNSQKDDKIKLAFLFILISQLLFFITYFPNYEQGAILGIASLLARHSQQTKNHDQISRALNSL